MDSNRQSSQKNFDIISCTFDNKGDPSGSMLEMNGKDIINRTESYSTTATERSSQEGQVQSGSMSKINNGNDLVHLTEIYSIPTSTNNKRSTSEGQLPLLQTLHKGEKSPNRNDDVITGKGNKVKQEKISSTPKTNNLLQQNTTTAVVTSPTTNCLWKGGQNVIDNNNNNINNNINNNVNNNNRNSVNNNNDYNKLINGISDDVEEEEQRNIKNDRRKKVDLKSHDDNGGCPLDDNGEYIFNMFFFLH